MNAVALSTALLLGAVLTSQIGINKQLGEHLGNLTIPALVNMVIGVVATFGITLAMTRQWPSAAAVRSAPWYDWLAGGVLGALYLTGNIILAPRLGAAALTGLVVTGQIVFSVMVDQFGWFGFEQHAASLPRLAGCLLLIGGIALISRS